MKENNIKNSILASIILPIAIVLFFVFCTTRNFVYDRISSQIGYANIFIYVLAVILYLLLLFLCFGVMQKITIAGKQSRRMLETVKIGSLLLSVGGTVGFLILTFLKAKNLFPSGPKSYLWQQYPIWMVVPCIILISILGFSFYKCDVSNKAYISILVLLVLAVGVAEYDPDFISKGLLHHPHAYFNSILNVLLKQPYTDLVQSIYGKYGLFYFVPVKLLGEDVIAIVLVIALITMASYGFLFYAAKKLYRNKGLGIMICTALVLITLKPEQSYWQLYPHRIVTTCILIGLCIFMDRIKVHKVIHELIFWLYGTCALLWNMETGVVCIVAYMAFRIYRSLCKYRILNIRVWGTVLFQAGMFVIEFISAYILFNGYNLLMGGSWQGIKTFIYPFASGSSYDISNLQVKLPEIYNSYMIILILFLVTVGFCLSRIYSVSKEQRGEKNNKPSYLFLIAILGIGQMVYYINRTAYGNLTIVYLEAVLLLGVLCDYGLQIKFERKMTGKMFELFACVYSRLSLIIISGLVFTSLITAGSIVKLRINVGQETIQLRQYAYEIRDSIPEGTVGFGKGVPELYSIMDWDPGCYCIDFSDMNPLNRAYVQEIINREDHLFVDGFVVNDTRFDMSMYKIEEEFVFSNSTYYYCIKE